MISILFWPLTFLFAIFLEILVQDFFSLVSFSPKVLLIATLFFSVREGALMGVCLGYLWGLFLDVSGNSLFGSQAFLLTLAGFIGGTFRGKIDETIPFAQMSIGGAASLGTIGGLAIFELLFGEAVGRYWSWATFWEPMAAGILSPLFFYGFNRWQRFFYERRRIEK